MVSATNEQLTQGAENYLNALLNLKPDRLQEIFTETVSWNSESISIEGKENKNEVSGRENVLTEYKKTFFDQVEEVQVLSKNLTLNQEKSQCVASYEVKQIFHGSSLTITFQDQLTFDSSGQVERIESVWKTVNYFWFFWLG